MDRINEFGERFGLGSVLGVDIPGERGAGSPIRLVLMREISGMDGGGLEV
jgi:hypothetical protein